jgi:hypothetical protein
MRGTLRAIAASSAEEHAVGVTGDPVLVTTAAKSPRQEQRERQRRYLITMGIRLVCFIMAIVLFGIGQRFLAAFAVTGSLVLPWIAVVAANAGPRRSFESPSLYRKNSPRQLPPGEG